MLEKQKLIDAIIERISVLQCYIRLSNKCESFDVNTKSEDFVCELLNLISKLKLINLNHEKKNHPAIDLGDEEEKLAIQVSSIASSKKIKETIDKFEKNKFYKKYDKLWIIAMCEKDKNTEKFKCNNDYDYDLRIFEISDFINSMKKQDYNKIIEIYEFIDQNICTIIPDKETLYKFEKENVKNFKDGLKFITFVCDGEYSDEDRGEIQRDLTILINLLIELNKKVRTLLYVIICCRIKSKKDIVKFSGVDVNYRAGNKNIEKDIKILLQHELIDRGKFDEEGYFELVAPICENKNIFALIDNFCNKQKYNLKELIINLNFTLLDEVN